MNGVVFQMSTAAMAGIAVAGSAIQATLLDSEMQFVDQQIVHDAVDVVVHPLPHLRRDDGQDCPRHEHRRAHRAAALEVRVDDQGDDHAQQELERDRQDREQHGDLDRVQELAVG